MAAFASPAIGTGGKGRVMTVGVAIAAGRIGQVAGLVFLFVAGLTLDRNMPAFERVARAAMIEFPFGHRIKSAS